MEIIDNNLNMIHEVVKKIKDNQITAIYSNDYSKINEWFDGIYKKKNTFRKKRNLFVKILDFDNFDFLTSSVKSEINFMCKINDESNKEFKIKLEKEFINFNLDILEGYRSLNSLSNTERKKLYLIINTIFDCKYIVIKNLFKNMDKISYKQCCNYLNTLVSKKTKVIIVDDINILYSFSKHIIIIKDNKLLIEGETKDVLNDVETLINNDLIPPYLPELTYLAKEKKGIKLFYQDDVRDVIKDVYKHVK